MKILILLMGAAAVLLSACETVPKPQKKTERVTEATIETAIETAIEATTEKLAEVKESPKLEKLIYGQEKPLVCTEPVAAEGALVDRPNMQVMWENYLYDRPDGIWGEIGGLVEVNGNLPFDQGQWTNACTVRLSYMLNKAGHKIPRARPKTVSGANEDQYYYRIADFEVYMIEAYGEPDLAILDGSANQFDLPITPGIVLMDFPDSSFTGHVTIWNGAGTVDGANIGGYRVLFWDLPCFIPVEREAIVSNMPDSAAIALP